MRLFVAVELSDEMKDSITASMHAMKKAGVGGRYVPKQNLHLTLAFIGETLETGKIREALSGVRFKPFRLSLDRLGTFGDLLWVGMKGNQGLSAAARDVRKALDEAGVDYDRKKFSPHITLIRKMTGPWQKVPAPKGEMMVKKITLMKSATEKGKRVYSEVFSIP
ncbi:MAG: RNA 2',3'-cyclic phosphodiesterase [Lachnospiraceae bacterium]|nr:RNA 2',3'-cyclic phosphodiesterase [Lachnospiraceae bacterium]